VVKTIVKKEKAAGDNRAAFKRTLHNNYSKIVLKCTQYIDCDLLVSANHHILKSICYEQIKYVPFFMRMPSNV
jgi:hypothetical protein